MLKSVKSWIYEVPFKEKKKWNGYHPKNSPHSCQGFSLHHCLAYVLCIHTSWHVADSSRGDAPGIWYVIFISSCLNDSRQFISILKRRLSRIVVRYATETPIHMWDDLVMIGTGLHIKEWCFQARTASILTLLVEEWRYNHFVKL